MVSDSGKCFVAGGCPAAAAAFTAPTIVAAVVAVAAAEMLGNLLVASAMRL